MSAAAAAANSKTAEAPAASAAATATFDPELAKLLGDNFVGQNDAKVTGDAFKGKGKTFGIYFSAHWCPPCRMFTPELVKTYNKLKTGTDTKDKFEIIFSSWDRDAKAFGQYFGSMPWIAIPFADKARNQALGAHFKVEGIPTLVIIDGETGAVITKNGRGAVDADPEGKAFPWTPQPAAELTPATVQDINDTAVLIGFFHNATDAVGAAGKAAITKLAEEVYADAKAKKAEPELNFWYGLKHAVVPKVAGFLRVPDDGSVGAVLVDIPNGVKYTVNKPAADVTYDVLKSFYADLRANKLKPEMLQ